MLFLEDLYATKRPTLEERRAQIAAKQPRPIRSQTARSETHIVGAQSLALAAQNQFSKRISIFSRRQSLAPTPLPGPDVTLQTISRTQTAPAPRRQTTTEMAGHDGDHLKTKFLSSWHPTKKSGSSKSVTPAKGSPTSKTRPSNPVHPVHNRNVHKRAMSVGGMVISHHAPAGN